MVMHYRWHNTTDSKIWQRHLHLMYCKTLWNTTVREILSYTKISAFQWQTMNQRGHVKTWLMVERTSSVVHKLNVKHFQKIYTKETQRFWHKNYKLCDSETPSMTPSDANVTRLTARTENAGHRLWHGQLNSRVIWRLCAATKTCCGTDRPNIKAIAESIGLKVNLKQGDKVTWVGILHSHGEERHKRCKHIDKYAASTSKCNFYYENEKSLKS